MASARKQPSRDPHVLPEILPYAISRDPLSQVTDQIRLSSLFCDVMRVTPPFAQSGATDGFHVILVTQGQIYVGAVDAADFAPILVETGDVLVMPRGVPFRFFYPLEASRAPEAELTHVVDLSKPRPGEIEVLGMLCYLDKAHRNLLTEFLPPVIHLKKGTPGLTRWLKRTIELFRAEYVTRSPGRGAILSRLVEIVCVQVLRIWIEQMPSETKGWIQGLKDEQIALALQAVHNNPGRPWTVASLARHAGMSRTAFAMRFKTLVGQSPMDYVSRWRMHRAVGLLEERSGSLKSVAEASGYKSTTTFRDNFKRHFGMLPSDYRRK